PCVGCAIRTGETPVPLRWKRRRWRNFVCLNTWRACEWLNTYPARRIVAWVSPLLPRSELPFRAARCRPLRQPRWLPLHPQADAKHVPDGGEGVSLVVRPEPNSKKTSNFQLPTSNIQSGIVSHLVRCSALDVGCSAGWDLNSP